jgi:hypothetical protein
MSSLRINRVAQRAMAATPSGNATNGRQYGMLDFKAAALTNSQELCALAGRRQRDHAAPAGPAPSAYALCALFMRYWARVGPKRNQKRRCGAVFCCLSVQGSVASGMGWALRRANGLRTRASLGLGYDVQCGVNARLHRRGDGGRRERHKGRGRHKGVGSKSGDGTASRPPTRCANGCGIRQEAIIGRRAPKPQDQAASGGAGGGKNRGVYRRQGGGSLAATVLAP